MASFFGVNFTGSNVSEKNGESSEESQQDIALATIVPLAVILFCGIVSNATVIVLVLAKMVPKKTTNLFVLNMSAADLVTLVLNIPWALMVYLTRNTHWAGGVIGDATCRMVIWLYNSTDWVSLITLLIISIERFKAVSSIAQRSNRSLLVKVSLISLSWSLPGLLNVPMLLICGVEKGTNLCDCSFTKSTAAYYVATNGLYVCLVISIISINLVIIRKLVRTQVAMNLPEAQREKRLRSFRSAVRMVLCSLLLFVFCTSPIYTLNTLLRLVFIGEIPLTNKMTTMQVYDALNIVFYVNAAFGPVIYFIFLDDFRKALGEVLRDIVRCQKTRANEEVQSEQPLEPRQSTLRTHGSYTNKISAEENYEAAHSDSRL
ncbi:predicted protein [Nematostella vectensis]|uniref:G-protein coupled receptors family 1 profile domain-containing protein n=1 Tax=Nematostella vectensis TaxID=45351 RepID=A7SLN8_NEMVE|nr:predicted protein [Nematostella vectensis]|eukprot:XP_001627482.1 predicted protein [Nematostella vectensis]